MFKSCGLCVKNAKPVAYSLAIGNGINMPFLDRKRQQCENYGKCFKGTP